MSRYYGEDDISVLGHYRNERGPLLIDLDRSGRGLGPIEDRRLGKPSSPEMMEWHGTTATHEPPIRSGSHDRATGLYARRGPGNSSTGQLNRIEDLRGHHHAALLRQDHERVQQSPQKVAWGTSIYDDPPGPAPAGPVPGSYKPILKAPWTGKSITDMPKPISQSLSSIHDLDLRHRGYEERRPSVPHQSTSHGGRLSPETMLMGPITRQLYEQHPGSSSTLRHDRSAINRDHKQRYSPPPLNAKHRLSDGGYDWKMQRSPPKHDERFKAMHESYPGEVPFDPRDPQAMRQAIPNRSQFDMVDAEERRFLKNQQLAEINRHLTMEAKRKERLSHSADRSDPEISIIEVRSSPFSSASMATASPRELRSRRSRDRDQVREEIGRDYERSRSAKRAFKEDQMPMPLPMREERMIVGPGELPCRFKKHGCNLHMSTSLLPKHEAECVFNPAIGKRLCNRCHLPAGPEGIRHDCVALLRRELDEERAKDKRVRITGQLSASKSNITSAFVKVVERNQSGEPERVELRMGDTAEDVLRLIIARLNAREENMNPETTGKRHVYRQWLDYQLVFVGLTKIHADTKLDIPFFISNESTFLLLPKIIEIGLKVTKMYHSDDSQVVSYKEDILMPIDPTKRIWEIKEFISRKLPVPIRWPRHDLHFRDTVLDDHQTVFSAGIFHGDIIEIIAVPVRNTPHVIN